MDLAVSESFFQLAEICNWEDVVMRGDGQASCWMHITWKWGAWDCGWIVVFCLATNRISISMGCVCVWLAPWFYRFSGQGRA